jgi:SAM-dependent methyltransferase
LTDVVGITRIAVTVSQGETSMKSPVDIGDLCERLHRLDQSLSGAIAEMRQAQVGFHRSTENRLHDLERKIHAAFADGAGEDKAIETAAAPAFRRKLRPDYQAFLGYFVALGGLRRHHSVLDVGCGHGRMMRELLAYLAPTARYDGVDVRGNIIEKLTRGFSVRYPHFNFHHANIYNKSYNPGATVTAREYVYPFEDGTFDFVFLLSIFTHLFPADMDHYLAEISRVLKKGRRCAITYFLLNDESIRLIESGAIRKTFRHRGEHFRFEDEDVPERAVAVDEEFVRQMYRRHGLKIIEPIYYGKWCRRRGPEMRQDMVVAVKE